MHPDIQQFWELNRMYVGLRDQLLDSLSDADLAYTPGGANPTLGELCKEMGETQHAYAQSFHTFAVDFSWRSDDPRHASSVAALEQWYAQLDADLEAALQTITDEDMKSKQMERGGYTVELHISLDILREALLIFYGKVSVYLKAMGKERPQMWQDWIA